MIYLDSNVFLYPLLYDPEKVPGAAHCTKILAEVISGQRTGATSCLTWDEIVHVMRKLAGVQVAREAGKTFLEFPNLKFLPVDEETLDAAQSLAGRYSLKPRDALHAASALQSGIYEFLSDDSDFDTVKELKRISPGEI
jgi:predicted nucleic acid-binding protein